MKTPMARRKMGEARFFLEQLQKEATRDRSERPEIFGYYLSAFLGAAASVIHVARKEIQIKESEFKAWEESLNEQQRTLLYYVKEQRRQEVHLEGATVVSKESRIARTFYPHVQPLSLSVMLRGSVEEGPKDEMTDLPVWIQVWIPKTEHHFVKGQAQTDPVLAECTGYMAVLEKFLSWVEKGK